MIRRPTSLVEGVGESGDESVNLSPSIGSESWEVCLCAVSAAALRRGPVRTDRLESPGGGSRRWPLEAAQCFELAVPRGLPAIDPTVPTGEPARRCPGFWVNLSPWW